MNVQQRAVLEGLFRFGLWFIVLRTLAILDVPLGLIADLKLRRLNLVLFDYL